MIIIGKHWIKFSFLIFFLFVYKRIIKIDLVPRVSPDYNICPWLTFRTYIFGTFISFPKLLRWLTMNKSHKVVSAECLLPFWRSKTFVKRACLCDQPPLKSLGTGLCPGSLMDGISHFNAGEIKHVSYDTTGRQFLESCTWLPDCSPSFFSFF